MAVTSYATVDEYRTDTGDTSTADERVTATLAQQSAKLRARCGIPATRELTEDQLALARLLVCDAARKCLVSPTVEALGDVAGLTQGSFSANGFQGSYTFSNPSGTAYFDRDTLAALLRSLGRSQQVGYIMPAIGGAR